MMATRQSYASFSDTTLHLFSICAWNAFTTWNTRQLKYLKRLRGACWEENIGAVIPWSRVLRKFKLSFIVFFSFQFLDSINKLEMKHFF